MPFKSPFLSLHKAIPRQYPSFLHFNTWVRKQFLFLFRTIRGSTAKMQRDAAHLVESTPAIVQPHLLSNLII